MQNEKVIYGFHSIIETLKSEREIERIYIRKGLKSDQLNELMTYIRNRKANFQYVPPEKLDKMTRQNHQGVVAVISEISYAVFEELIPEVLASKPNPIFLILDGVTDVRNLGAITRTAECAGVDAVIIPQRGMAQVNAEAVKSSAGALSLVAVSRVSSLKSAVRYMQQLGIKVMAATEKTDKLMYNADLTGPTALVLGAEDKGISEDILKIADEMIRIPMFGTISSLNVSVAASVIIYETIRQRVV